MTNLPPYFKHDAGAYRYRIINYGAEHLFGESGLRGYLRGLCNGDDTCIKAILTALDDTGTWTDQGITIHRLDPISSKNGRPRGGTNAPPPWPRLNL